MCYSVEFLSFEIKQCERNEGDPPEKVDPSCHAFRFRDKRGLQSKIANFPHPRVFNVPAEWVPLGIG